MSAAIIAAGEAPYTRHPEPGQTTLTFLRDGIAAALHDAGLKPRDVDGLGVSSLTLAPDHAIDVAFRLGLKPRWLMQDTSLSGINMLNHAVRGIEAGDASVIVIVAGDAMGGTDFAASVANFNSVFRDHLAPLDFGGPNALFAMLTQRQMIKFDLAKEHYGHIAVAQRAWAGGNPGAVYRKPLTMAEYLQAPIVAAPLNRFDCVPVVAGASAIVVASEERAPPGRAPVRVRAIRQNFNQDDQVGDGLTTGLADVAQGLWREAGMSQREIDLAMVYDDYPAMVLAQFDDLGFVPDHDLARFAASEIGTRHFPVNTSGGLMSAGQAGAAAGVHGLVEATRQLQHRAEGRQVPNARRALVTGYGMVTYRHGAYAGAAILERAT